MHNKCIEPVFTLNAYSIALSIWLKRRKSCIIDKYLMRIIYKKRITMFYILSLFKPHVYCSVVSGDSDVIQEMYLSDQFYDHTYH